MSPPLRLAADEIASVVLHIGDTRTLLQSRLVACAFCCEPLQKWRKFGFS